MSDHRRSRLLLAAAAALPAVLVASILLRPAEPPQDAPAEAPGARAHDAEAPATHTVATGSGSVDPPVDRSAVATGAATEGSPPAEPDADPSVAVRGRLVWAGRPLSSASEGAPCAIDGTLHLERVPRDGSLSTARSVPLEGGRFELPRALFDRPDARLRVVRVQTASGSPVFVCDDPPIGPGAGDVAVRVADRAGLFVRSDVEGRFLGEVHVAVVNSSRGPASVGAVPAPRDAARALATPRPTPLEREELAQLPSVFLGAPGHAWRPWRAEATWPPRPEVVRLGPGGDLHLEGPGLAEGLRSGRVPGQRVELARPVGAEAGPGSAELVWTVRDVDLSPAGRIERSGIPPGSSELTLYRLQDGIVPVGATRHAVAIEAGAVTVLEVDPLAERNAIVLEFARPADRERLTGLRFGLESGAESVASPRPADGEPAPATLELRPDRDLTALEHLTLEPFELTFDIRRAACWEAGRLTLRVPPLEPLALRVTLDGVPVRPTAFGAAAFLDCGGGPAAPTVVPEPAPVEGDAPRLDRVSGATHYVALEVDGERHFDQVPADRLADGELRLHSRLPVEVRLERHGLGAGRSLEWWAAVGAVDAAGADCGDVRVTRTEPLGGRSPFADARTPIEAATLLVPSNAVALVAPAEVGRVALPSDWTRGEAPSLVLAL